MHLPADAASRSSIMNSNGAKPDLVFPVISDVHIYTDNDKNLNKFKTTLEQLNTSGSRIRMLLPLLGT